MEATAAHIHQGARGQNGPVIIPLTKSSDNTWSVPPDAKFTDAHTRVIWQELSTSMCIALRTRVERYGNN